MRTRGFLADSFVTSTEIGNKNMNTLSSHVNREDAVASFTKRLLTHLKSGIDTRTALKLLADDPHIAWALPELKGALDKIKTDEKGGPSYMELFEHPIFSVFYQQFTVNLYKNGTTDLSDDLAALLSVYGFEKNLNILSPDITPLPEHYSGITSKK